MTVTIESKFEEAPELNATEVELLLNNGADQETQNARYAALKGKNLLYVSGSGLYPSMGRSLYEFCQYLKSKGVTITMVFQEKLKNDKYYQIAKQESTFDIDIFADMKGPNAADNIAKVAKETGLKFDGAWTPHEAVQKLNSQVQEKLNLPGNKPECYDAAQNKYATRKALEKANLNTLKAAQIWELEDCDKAEEIVGYPLICKPSTGMGSSGVYKVTNREELDNAVTRILGDISSNWTLQNSSTGNDKGDKTGQAPILAETFVDPMTFGKGDLITEFDVECLFWDGELQYANVVDNWFTLAPYFQDRGFNAPSVTPLQIQKEMIEYSAACVKALGFEKGNFHMECWYTTKGPILIEANPRVGGGSINDTHKSVWGVNPTENFVMAMLNIPVNPPRKLETATAYGFALVNAEKTGIINDSNFIKSTNDSTMIKSLDQFKFEGNDVIGLDTGVPEWLCQIDFESKNNTSVVALQDEMTRVVDKLTKAASECTTPRPL